MQLRSHLLGIVLTLFLGKSGLAIAADERLVLTQDGLPVCKLVVCNDPSASTLLLRSADLIAETVKKWSAVELGRVVQGETDETLPNENAIVFATLDMLQKLAPTLAGKDEFRRVAELDPQGFACIPLTNEKSQQLFIISQTPRGVFNGAVYLRDFAIDGPRENLCMEFLPIVRSPKMGGRAAYTLTIWGNEDLYTANDWAAEFPSFARDGIDRVYFWVSGHFPSKKFPQTYRVETVEQGKSYDTTVNTKIGTVDDLKAIVRSAHQQGLKIYLGGGLGSWCGTINITNEAKETMKIGPKERSLCPSHLQVRKALVEYYQEMFAAVPEADGLFIESADEVGACLCPSCDKPIDSLGSKQFGQSQLTLCQEIMDAVWRDHPHARLAYTIGYPEHVKDVAYYNAIQQLSKDPRFEWMEARGSWSFPGPDGESQPAPYFSNQVMRWQEYHKTSLEQMITDANRIGSDGMYGMILSFSPGYYSGSFYKDIPFPTDILPYALTGFVYREATWDPALTVEQMRDRTQKRFFGKEAPKYLGDDLWKLREMIRTRKGIKELNAIDEHIQEARSTAGPKTLEGLDVMSRASGDLRIHLTRKKEK